MKFYGNLKEVKRGDFPLLENMWLNEGISFADIKISNSRKNKIFRFTTGNKWKLLQVYNNFFRNYSTEIIRFYKIEKEPLKSFLNIWENGVF